MSEVSGGAPDLSAIISGLLSNPAAMSMLSSLLSGMGNSASATAAGPPAQSASEGGAPIAPPPLPPASTAFAPMAGPPVGARDERAALLYALRPFLPPEKCEMIDGLLRILDLLTLIRGRR